MAYRITMRRGHPHKQYRRDGRTYVEGTPVVLDELSAVLRAEVERAGSWLLCEEIAPPAPAEAPTAASSPPAALAPASPSGIGNLEDMKMGDLRQLAKEHGISARWGVTKKQLAARLREHLKTRDK